MRVLPLLILWLAEFFDLSKAEIDSNWDRDFDLGCSLAKFERGLIFFDSEKEPSMGGVLSLCGLIQAHQEM